MKCSGLSLRIIACLSACVLVAPCVMSQNSVGLRLGFNVLTGDREDNYTFDSFFNLELDLDVMNYEFVNSSLPGPQDMDATNLFFGGEGNFALPYNPRFIISPVFEYFRKTTGYDLDAAALEFIGVEPDLLTYMISDQVEYSLLSFMVNLKYLVLAEEYRSAIPYVGGGIGLHRWNVDVRRVLFGGTVDYQEPTLTFLDTQNFIDSDSDSGWSFGAQFLAGVGFNIHPQIEPFAEFQYRLMQKTDAQLFDPSLIYNESLSANFNGLQFLGGVRFKF